MDHRLLLSLIPLLLMVSCETSQPQKRYYLSSYRGMEEHVAPLGNKSMVKKTDPARLKRYTKVIVEDVKVIRSKSQDPRITKVTRAESEKLAERFEDILEKELAKDFQITRSRGYNTLTVRAALTELKPSNPTVFALNYVPYASRAATAIKYLSESKETIGAGSTTVEAEVLDSRSRRQLYAMVDRLNGSKFQPGGLERWGHSEAAMRSWSRKIRNGVNAKANTVGSTSRTTSNTASKKTSIQTSKKKSTSSKPATKKKTTSSKPSTKKKTGDRKPLWIPPSSDS